MCFTLCYFWQLFKATCLSSVLVTLQVSNTCLFPKGISQRCNWQRRMKVKKKKSTGFNDLPWGSDLFSSLSSFKLGFHMTGSCCRSAEGCDTRLQCFCFQGNAAALIAHLDFKFSQQNRTHFNAMLKTNSAFKINWNVQCLHNSSS